MLARVTAQGHPIGRDVAAVVALEGLHAVHLVLAQRRFPLETLVAALAGVSTWRSVAEADGAGSWRL